MAPQVLTCNAENSAIFELSSDRGLNLPVGFVIDRSGGLIENQDLCVQDDGAS